MTPNTIIHTVTAHVKPNDPTRAGAPAGRRVTFGAWRRYALYPIHTRFDAVCWIVQDAEQTDEETGLPAVVRMADDPTDALVGLALAESY